MACKPRCFSSQSAAARCAACVHAAFGSDRSISPRAAYSISLSVKQLDIFELLGECADEAQREPRRWRGLAESARSAWVTHTRGPERPREMPAVQSRTGCWLSEALDNMVRT